MKNRGQTTRSLFHVLLDEIVVNDIRLATNGGFVLGRARFAEEIARMLGRRVARGKPGRPPQPKDGRANAIPAS
jgi:putative transposase